MSFGYYRALTIDHTKVSTNDQSNFPVLVAILNNSLRTTTWGGHVQNASGYDVGFYSDVGLTTKLDWEVERYVGSTGEFRAWVRVPSLSTSVDTVIYLAYGNAALSSFQGNINGTWNANFKAVQHFNSTGPQPSRSAQNPIINYGGGWKDSQVFDESVLIDPSDSSKLVMFFCGMAAPVQTGIQSIGRATSTVADPTTWTEYGSNPILQRGAGGAWDNSTGGIRCDSVIWNADDSKFYLYYTADDSTASKVGLATSSDGITFTKYASNPVLVPSGDEVHVSQMAVYKDGSNWYCLYAYRTAGATLPGYRYASSSDGLTWTKSGGTVLGIGAAGTYDSTYMEFHQLTKVGAVYYCFYECYDGTTWRVAVAKASTVNGTWTKASTNPLMEKSDVAGAFDQYHIATPWVISIGGVYWLYYCGSNGSAYSTSNWALAVASLDSFAPIDLFTTQASATTDATSNANDLTAFSSPGVFNHGEIGAAMNAAAGGSNNVTDHAYEGNGYFQTPLADVSYAAGTIEWWMAPYFAYNGGYANAFWGQLASDEFSAQKYSDNNWYIGWRAGGVDGRVSIAASSGNLTQFVWQHYALVWASGALAKLYRNGVLIGTASNNTTVSNLATNFSIGRQGAAAVAGSEALIDEFRIHNTNRAVDWLLTSYNAQSAPGSFYSVGTEQAGPSGIPIPVAVHHRKMQGIA